MEDMVFKIYKSLKFLNPILSADIDDNRLILSDNAYGIFCYCINDEKLIFGKRVFKNSLIHHIYSKAVCISDKKVLLSEVNGFHLGIYEVVDDKVAISERIKWHKANISCVAFSPDSSLFATGGEDGRVFIHTTKDRKLYALCPIQPDYIACMRFDATNSFLVLSVYNHKILIYDLKACEFIWDIQTPSVCIDMHFFENDKKLFYICKDGESGIIDFISKENHIKKTYDAWLNCCVISNHKNYAYIVGRDNIFRIHCLRDNENLFELQLPDSGVSFIGVFGHYICVCFISGKVIFIDEDHGKQEMYKFLHNKNFEEAKIFAEENNIFLKLDERYISVRSENWREVLEDSIKLFANNQIENALHIAQPYLEDSKINREFKRYLNQKQILLDFLGAIENKLYYKAYQIAERQKGLKDLRVFDELENYFEKILEASKKMLEQDYGNQILRVKKILEPFMLIPQKKERIEILFNHFDRYMDMVNCLKNHSYKKAYEVAKKYPYLQATRAYAKIFNYYKEISVSLQNQVLQEIDKNAMAEQLMILEEVDLFALEVKMLKDFFDAQQAMQKAFECKNYIECYQILQDHPQLLTCKCYLEIESSFLVLFKKATDYAQCGKTSEVYEILKDFFVLEKWKNRLDIIFQIAYFYEIKNATMDSNIDWKKTLQNYISYFDESNEFKELCMQKNLDKILEDIVDIKKQAIKYKKTIIERLENA